MQFISHCFQHTLSLSFSISWSAGICSVLELTIFPDTTSVDLYKPSKNTWGSSVKEASLKIHIFYATFPFLFSQQHRAKGQFKSAQMLTLNRYQKQTSEKYIQICTPYFAEALEILLLDEIYTAELNEKHCIQCYNGRCNILHLKIPYKS